MEGRAERCVACWKDGAFLHVFVTASGSIFNARASAVEEVGDNNSIIWLGYNPAHTEMARRSAFTFRSEPEELATHILGDRGKGRRGFICT